MQKFNLTDDLIYRKLIKTIEYSYCSLIVWGKWGSIGKCKVRHDWFSWYNYKYANRVKSSFGVTDLASGPVIIDQNGLVQKLEKLL